MSYGRSKELDALQSNRDTLLKLYALEKLTEKSPNSHFPHWEGRSENKTFSDIITHFFRFSQVSIMRQIKRTGVEMNWTLIVFRGKTLDFFFLKIIRRFRSSIFAFP